MTTVGELCASPVLALFDQPRSYSGAGDHRVECLTGRWDQRRRDELELGEHAAEVLAQQNCGDPGEDVREFAIKHMESSEAFIARRVRHLDRRGALR